MAKTIAITCPTGNVGSKLPAYYQQAREQDVAVVVLARKPEDVAHWARAGARVHAGHLEDRDFVASATRGVDVLFWATPNSFAPGVTMRAGYRLFAESAAHAIRSNEIPHTVHLSGFAHVDDGGGEHSLFGALAESEAILGRTVEELQRTNPNGSFSITHLRAGFFFENLIGQLDTIREKGRVYLPVNRSRRIPMVASRDVAQRVAALLLQSPPRGRVYQGVWGPTDLSFGEVSAALTEGLGRDVRVVWLPRALIRCQMLKIGRDPRATDGFLFAFRAISKGKVTADPPRDAASTTPTTLVQWAREELKPLIDGDARCPARVQYEPPKVAKGAPPAVGGA